MPTVLYNFIIEILILGNIFFWKSCFCKQIKEKTNEFNDLENCKYYLLSSWLILFSLYFDVMGQYRMAVS